MGFLPAKFELATPFCSRLVVRHRTDKQMERQNWWKGR